MPEIVRALSTLPFDNEALESVRKAIGPGALIHVDRHNQIAFNAALREADVAFLSWDIGDRLLRGEKLRWVHFEHGGIERSTRPEVFEKGILLTSAAGRSAPALAEHVIFFMLALSFDYPRFYEAQRARCWGVLGTRDLRALRGLTVGLIGFGHIGVEVARRARAFDMRIIAYRRRAEHSPYVDQLFCSDRGEGPDTLLRESDFVVLTVPLTDQTRRIIGGEQLSLMKSSAHLINIARGGLVDEAALTRALEEGTIAGAALDVTETEPLPARSPLWHTPNLIITPHFTPPLSDKKNRSLDILCENIRRYQAGEALLNAVNAEDVFTLNKETEDEPMRLFSRVRSARALARRSALWLLTKL